MRPTTLSTLLIALVATACAAGTGVTDAPSATESGRPARSHQFATLPPSAAPVVGEVPATILDPILADAAERSSMDVSEIEVLTAEAVTWPDGSLGCPEPDMVYTQALVDGYHVVVAAGDERLDYRVGQGGSLRLCENGRPGEGG